MAFSDDSCELGVSSDKGTIHIFQLNKNGLQDIENEISNKKESKSKIGKLIDIKGYLTSQWSDAKFRTKEEKVICCLGPHKTVICLGASGKYYKASYADPGRDGECTKLQELKFID